MNKDNAASIAFLKMRLFNRSANTIERIAKLCYLISKCRNNTNNIENPTNKYNDKNSTAFRRIQGQSRPVGDPRAKELEIFG
jgi:hypothetical protein